MPQPGGILRLFEVSSSYAVAECGRVHDHMITMLCFLCVYEYSFRQLHLILSGEPCVNHFSSLGSNFLISQKEGLVPSNFKKVSPKDP